MLFLVLQFFGRLENITKKYFISSCCPPPPIQSRQNNGHSGGYTPCPPHSCTHTHRECVASLPCRMPSIPTLPARSASDHWSWWSKLPSLFSSSLTGLLASIVVSTPCDSQGVICITWISLHHFPIDNVCFFSIWPALPLTQTSSLPNSFCSVEVGLAVLWHSKLMEFFPWGALFAWNAFPSGFCVASPLFRHH